MPESAPAVAPSPALLAGRLSPEIIGKRIEQLSQSSGLDEQTRERAVALYREAIDHLAAEAAWRAKAAEFERLQAEAPALLERVRRQAAARKSELPLPASLELAELEQQLAKSEAELAAARQVQADLEQERKHRAERRAEVPRKLAEATQALQELAARFAEGSPPPSAEPALAEWVAAQARRRALEAEVEAYRKEILSYDARRELLAARLDQAAREVARLEARVEKIRSAVTERRRLEAERRAREAKTTSEKVAGKHPVL
ncbi:MAG: hypothetical protein D6815_11855, partial [Candidatus Dadabacteria bacterium]